MTAQAVAKSTPALSFAKAISTTLDLHKKPSKKPYASSAEVGKPTTLSTNGTGNSGANERSLMA